MARSTVKATYALDPDTVQALERMARRWGVSKSEALRRAIRAAATSPAKPAPALAALDALQRSVGLTQAAAAAWVRQLRTERRASVRQRLSS